uniref:UDP-glycosyltransferase n=1 Tax=Xylotrechus quadripes TaxID=554073 RepID=A0A6G7SF49_9CUCU|nr:UDP-glycosyltransferase [Xylotrechus quadripes]
MKLLFVTLCLFSCLYYAENANIFAAFPFPGKSHFNMFESILVALAEKGHNVDVMSHFPRKKPIKGYTDFSLVGTRPFFTNNVSIDMFIHHSKFSELQLMMSLGGYDTCESTFNSEIAKNIRNSSHKYDLVITELFATDCMLGWGYHFGAPVVALSSSAALPWANDRFGNPDNPSYIPSYIHNGGDALRMTLYERVVNTFWTLYAKLIYNHYDKVSNRMAKEFFGEDMPDLSVLAYNTSLLLTNSHFSIFHARPTVPNFVEVAGVHLRDPKPLNQHFEDLLKTDTEGIIYLSMGSMVMTEKFPPNKVQGIADALGELPYKVVWKGVRENFPEGVTFPKNVVFEGWMPQLDILCHPNVKLFITHGGLMGSQEAIYCGVPRLGIPLFGDQVVNIKQSERLGIAAKVAYEDISKGTILAAATKLLNDPSYQENAKLASERFKDRPMSALNTSLYWIEYVIRHKGAPQLRSIGAQLPWYQYYLLDIAVIFLLPVLGLGYLLSFVFKLLFSVKVEKSKRD